MNQTYTVIAKCGNCDFHSPVEIKTGIEVCQNTCPNCGCKTLSSHPVHCMTMDEKVVKLL
ncbi:hypothetical protein LCGC14_2327950 [marine sediment metagenome]|uniref:Uncharacterized protein n=1 Tax=marine sediment metagenome TaxID=412755 RepID=A0A0F9CGF6_9ZZZZ